jgi:hypothetical protein
MHYSLFTWLLEFQSGRPVFFNSGLQALAEGVQPASHAAIEDLVFDADHQAAEERRVNLDAQDELLAEAFP